MPSHAWLESSRGKQHEWREQVPKLKPGNKATDSGIVEQSNQWMHQCTKWVSCVQASSILPYKVCRRKTVPVNICAVLVRLQQQSIPRPWNSSPSWECQSPAHRIRQREQSSFVFQWDGHSFTVYHCIFNHNHVMIRREEGNDDKWCAKHLRSQFNALTWDHP